ncbi:MAG: pirin family protein [Armatimonas sp.]
MKPLLSLQPSPEPHWVGDGFPVRTLFSYAEAESVTPFLMLDYAAPTEISPSDTPKGVGAHPHKGFETVTIVYQGELEHRDSTGHKGQIGSGDVQWMTAASGIVHAEYHSPEFARTGGIIEMMQLWVNLPAKDKIAPPGYQTLLSGQIPTVTLPGGSGSVRVIAGELDGVKGPARTFTPINVWDTRLAAGHTTTLPAPDGHTTILAVLRGTVLLNGEQTATEGMRAMFDRNGEGITLQAQGDTEALVLVLTGEPILEPVAAYGPFVMNTEMEIRQAMYDYRVGKLGKLEEE